MNLLIQRTKKYGFGTTICLCCVVLSLSGCGIFSPRSAEEPDSPFVDPLHIGDILNSTGKQFISTRYRDILSDTLEYFQRNYDIENKAALIGRLEYINELYPEISVTWLSDSTEVDDLREGRGTVYRTYTVWLNGYDGTIAGDYRGNVVFQLIESVGVGWKIYGWDDVPTDTVGNAIADRSFFHPDF